MSDEAPRNERPAPKHAKAREVGGGFARLLAEKLLLLEGQQAEEEKAE